MNEEDYRAVIRTAKKKGLQEGVDAASRRIAKAMKERGLPESDIAEMTGLCLSQVMEL